MRCDHCGFFAKSKEQFAGHLSGHVRRGEIPQRKKNMDHVCNECCESFSSGYALGGHKQLHKKSFEKLKCDGSRKLRLIRERGHVCESCKNTTWQGQQIPLHLDHKDGNPDNSERKNLRVLCPNCHALTPTYDGKNVGKFPNAKRYRYMRKWKQELR